jgi:hypothetical protein
MHVMTQHTHRDTYVAHPNTRRDLSKAFVPTSSPDELTAHLIHSVIANSDTHLHAHLINTFSTFKTNQHRIFFNKLLSTTFTHSVDENLYSNLLAHPIVGKIVYLHLTRNKETLQQFLTNVATTDNPSLLEKTLVPKYFSADPKRVANALKFIQDHSTLAIPKCMDWFLSLFSKGDFRDRQKIAEALSAGLAPSPPLALKSFIATNIPVLSHT